MFLHQSKGSYRCGNCPLGYDGDGRTCTASATRPYLQCSDSSMCNVNAQCFQYANSPPSCICSAGYSGNGFGPNGCIVSAQDPCSAVRCRNGGTCMRNGTSAYCACPPGTRQPLCDRTVDRCLTNPCLNGGNCTSLPFGRNYLCRCPRGFSGNNCQNQVRRCGGVRNAENGTIAYPEESGGVYSHNSRCAWLIKTNHTKVLKITFKKFEIEESRDCKFDWLQIHDGRSSSSFMIGRFCGTTKPKGGSFVSTHNQLYLWFRSDNSTAHDGFELSWESVNPGKFMKHSLRTVLTFYINIRVRWRHERNNAWYDFKSWITRELSDESRLRVVHYRTARKTHSIFVLHTDD